MMVTLCLARHQKQRSSYKSRFVELCVGRSTGTHAQLYNNIAMQKGKKIRFLTLSFSYVEQIAPDSIRAMKMELVYLWHDYA